tara:strand:+ start:19 stop:1428 length:1410 start_codon:yes stop_codon:yes gene_type:complete
MSNVATVLSVDTPAGHPDRLVVRDVEYQVVRPLGQGSYAFVYEVVGPRGERLAAKCVDQGTLSAWARGQLSAEVQIQQSLVHPHILRMHVSGEDALVPGRFVCILDIATGGELFERIMEQQSFVEEDARRVIRQLLGAVSHMHKHGVLHRDLKPENILLETAAHDSAIKVADFGSAKRLASAGPSAYANTPCGSMGYAAPEQIALLRYEREVDVWSVGIIAYVLLSGSMPFDPAHYVDALASENFEVVLLPEQWAGVSDDAKAFVLALLQLQPSSRPKVEQALKHPWLAPQPPTPLQQPQLSTPRQLKRMHEAGMLRHHFAHANEIWHYACSTPNMKGGSGLPDAAMQMPSPLLLPTALEVPMAPRESEVPLLLPRERLREKAEAQRAKRRKLQQTPATGPAAPPRDGLEPPALDRDTSFNKFELPAASSSPTARAEDGGSPLLSRASALRSGSTIELSPKGVTLSGEL